MTTGSEIFLKEFRKEAFPELDPNCFIRKPIANEDLLKRMQEVLELKKKTEMFLIIFPFSNLSNDY